MSDFCTKKRTSYAHACARMRVHAYMILILVLILILILVLILVLILSSVCELQKNKIKIFNFINLSVMAKPCHLSFLERFIFCKKTEGVITTKMAGRD